MNKKYIRKNFFKLFRLKKWIKNDIFGDIIKNIQRYSKEKFVAEEVM